jgi:hypothetical protein
MAIEYYEGTKIHKVGFPILIVASHEVPDTHVLVVEWFLYIAPLRGKIDRVWNDRIVHTPDPDAPPVEPNAPVVTLALLREAAKSKAKRVLARVQEKVYKKTGEAPVLTEPAFSPSDQNLLMRLWITRIGTVAILDTRDYTKLPEVRAILRQIIALPQTFSDEFGT